MRVRVRVRVRVGVRVRVRVREHPVHQRRVAPLRHHALLVDQTEDAVGPRLARARARVRAGVGLRLREI